MKLQLLLGAVSICALLTMAPTCQPPMPAADAGGPPADAATSASVDAALVLPAWDQADVCGSAAARATALGCALPRADAGTWDVVCRNARGRGLRFFDVRCAEMVSTRSSLTECGITCE